MKHSEQDRHAGMVRGLDGFWRPADARREATRPCTCGYEGTSAADLDEHLIAASGLDPEGAHRPTRR